MYGGGGAGLKNRVEYFAIDNPAQLGSDLVVDAVAERSPKVPKTWLLTGF